MKNYKKRPIIIQAVKWEGNNFDEVQELDYNPSNRVRQSNVEEGKLLIVTLEGIMTATLGDWVVRGVEGELYPCKPSVFDSTYEDV